MEKIMCTRIFFLLLLLTTNCLASYFVPNKSERETKIPYDVSKLRGWNVHQILNQYKMYNLLKPPSIKTNPISQWFNKIGGRLSQNQNIDNVHRSVSLSVEHSPLPNRNKPAVSVYKVQFKFPNIFDKFHKVGAEEKDENKDECTKKGGKLVLNECYKYFNEAKNYFDALVDCQSKGGILWTPDLTNPFLNHFLAQIMPEIVSGMVDRIWAGGYFRNNRVVTIEGDDITDSYAIHVDRADQSFDENECLVVELANGGLNTGSYSCTISMFTYVCEFGLKTTTKVVAFKKG